MLPLLALLAAVPGQTQADPLSGDWLYRAFDASGRIVAHGTMTIRPALHIERLSYGYKDWTHIGNRSVIQRDGDHGPHSEKSGMKELEELKAKYPGALDGIVPLRHRLFAVVRGDRMQADLNANSFDNNVLLEGRFRNGRIEGAWKWATFIGYRSKGTFLMERSKHPR